MRQPISIRRSLLFNLAVVVMALSITFFGVIMGSTGDTVRYLSISLTNQALARTEAQLARFFDPLKRNLLVAQGWGNAGILNVDDPVQFRNLAQPLLEQHPHMSSVLLASSDGRELMLMRDGDTWALRQTRAQDWPGTPLRYRWTNRTPDISTEWRESNYDSRQRPWYQLATRYAEQHPEQQQWVRWTEPYTFFTSKEPGLTAVTTFKDQSGQSFVLGFDVALLDLSAFTTQLQIGESGRVVVLTEDNRIVGLPRDSRYMDRKTQQSVLLQNPEQLGFSLARDATHAFQTRTSSPTEPLRFTSNGTAWWAHSQPFPLTEDHALTIVVLIPETELLGKLANTGLWLALATFLALGWGLWRSHTLAQRYSAPIERLVTQSERISRGDLRDAPPIESSVMEIRRLEEAHDHMRSGLRSLMKLESDMQVAREIQQRSFPRSVSILSGYDIAGLAKPAEATGGDIYDVIGYCSSSACGSSAPLDPNPTQALLIVADATGHGIGPALSVTQVRAMLRMAVRARMPLEAMVRHINDQLHSDLHEGRFITAWLGQLNATEHRMRFFSAGQAPLLLLRANATACEVLSAQGPPLGILEPYPDVTCVDIDLHDGDLFMVVSDGVTDARNVAQHPFGEERLQQLVTQHAHQSATDLLHSVRDELARYCANTQQRDDQTILVIKRVIE